MEKDLKIFKSKTLADGSKYFSLFEKHIPALNVGSRVYLYMLGNLHCICEIIQKNPNAKYFIYDSDEVFNAVRIVMDNIDISKTVDLYDIDMKFDCIVMNPPYQKNLHLKILAEAIKHLKDDESSIVNLSPDHWLTNPYKMFEKEKQKRVAVEIIANHIAEFETINANTFNGIFNTSSWFGVGIFKLVINKTGFDIHQYDMTNPFMLKLIGKICSMKSLRSQFSRRTAANFFVPVRRTNHGYLNWCEENDNYIKSKDGIQFSCKEEVENFKNATNKTWLYKYLAKCDWSGGQNSASVPWMGDSINPRTGLKGYTGEWTDDDLVLYFDITPEEYNIIKKTMEKYK